MSKHVTNAAYGVVDYASYPIGMVLVAPVVLHKLGASEYGLWMIATALISAGGIVASGFCDANIQRVAHLRGIGSSGLIPNTVRGILAISMTLGLLLSVAAWIAAPYAVARIAIGRQVSPSECLISLRIASVLIFVRAIESVAVSTQRAFEQYRGTVQISSAVRLLTLASAAVLACLGQGTSSILAATAVLLAFGTSLQFLQLPRFLGVVSLWPRFHPTETRALLGLGIFVWVQAIGGVVFGQLDRIVLGLTLGALAVAPYSLCVQFAHPIFGLTASGLSFLFPYLSGRASTLSTSALKRSLLKAFACNFLLVACGTGLLLQVGPGLVRLWAGPVVAQGAAQILVPIVLGSALMGLSVTGTYAMQALGQFHTDAFISLGSRISMLLLMIELMRQMGLQGLALSRLCYGPVALLVYLPLLWKFDIGTRERNDASALARVSQVQEGAKP
jgi:O-antigen/teichoic acid export membrane protein